MDAVSEFILYDDSDSDDDDGDDSSPFLELDSARPAIRFLARSLECGSMSLNPNSGTYRAVWAFQEVAAHGHVYIREMINVGMVGICIGLMRDLMSFNSEDSRDFLMKAVTYCIQSLVHHGNTEKHFEVFMEAGIVDVSMEYWRSWTPPGEDGLSLPGYDDDDSPLANITFYTCRLVWESSERALVFADAGTADFLPLLLQDDSSTEQRQYGCMLANALARSTNNAVLALLLQSGCFRLMAKLASEDPRSGYMFFAIDTLACLCIFGRNDLVLACACEGSHVPLFDAMEENRSYALKRDEHEEFWEQATKRVRSFRENRMIMPETELPFASV